MYPIDLNVYCVRRKNRQPIESHKISNDDDFLLTTFDNNNQVHYDFEIIGTEIRYVFVNK